MKVFKYNLIQGNLYVGGEQMKIRAKTIFSDLRIKKGFSQTNLAIEMGVNPSVIFRLEKSKNVRPSTAKRVCEVMNEEFDTLFIIEE